MVEMEVRKVTKGVESNMVAFDFERTPITQIADYIIITASRNNASDIHFDPRDESMMVRFRIDGDLQDYTNIPKLYERTLTTRLKLLAGMNITESRLPQDGAIKGEFGGQYLDMRVSCLPLNTGEKIVIRILDYTRSLKGVEHLGFNQTNLKKIKRMMGVPNGIILVTGATGSGKSTTVYSILQELNRPETNIITVEDPIEMDIEGMNQVQVNAEIGMTFAAALRSILRQDPNIILIGEIRDSETAQIAVRASITGHLVLSTIHTNNALSTIERLLDMDVERYLLSTSLTGIIAQRLAKKLCTHCRIERETTKYEKKVFKKFMNRDIEKIYDANPKGCENCRNGYKGRIAVHEVLEIDDEIRNALAINKMTKEELSKMVYGTKTITMLQDALGKAISGLTSFEEVYRVIEIETEPDDDTAYLTRAIEDVPEVIKPTSPVQTAPKATETSPLQVTPTTVSTTVPVTTPATVAPSKVSTPVNTNKAVNTQNTEIKTPILLTKEQEQQQAENAKIKLKELVEAENAKKLAEVISKPQEVQRAKLVVQDPKLNPVPVQTKTNTENETQNKEKAAEQPIPIPIPPQRLYQLPRSSNEQLPKQVKTTSPKIEKMEKAIPELNIKIKTNDKKATIKSLSGSPIFENSNLFEEKDKVKAIDLNKISQSIDLKKEEKVINPLKPTVKPDESNDRGNNIPVIIETFSIDDSLRSAPKLNAIKLDQIKNNETVPTTSKEKVAVKKETTNNSTEKFEIETPTTNTSKTDNKDSERKEQVGTTSIKPVASKTTTKKITKATVETVKPTTPVVEQKVVPTTKPVLQQPVINTVKSTVPITTPAVIKTNVDVKPITPVATKVNIETVKPTVPTTNHTTAKVNIEAVKPIAPVTTPIATKTNIETVKPTTPVVVPKVAPTTKPVLQQPVTNTAKPTVPTTIPAVIKTNVDVKPIAPVTTPIATKTNIETDKPTIPVIVPKVAPTTKPVLQQPVINTVKSVVPIVNTLTTKANIETVKPTIPTTNPTTAKVNIEAVKPIAPVTTPIATKTNIETVKPTTPVVVPKVAPTTKPVLQQPVTNTAKPTVPTTIPAVIKTNVDVKPIAPVTTPIATKTNIETDKPTIPVVVPKVAPTTKPVLQQPVVNTVKSTVPITTPAVIKTNVDVKPITSVTTPIAAKVNIETVKSTTPVVEQKVVPTTNIPIPSIVLETKPTTPTTPVATSTNKGKELTPIDKVKTPIPNIITEEKISNDKKTTVTNSPVNLTSQVLPEAITKKPTEIKTDDKKLEFPTTKDPEKTFLITDAKVNVIKPTATPMTSSLIAEAKTNNTLTPATKEIKPLVTEAKVAPNIKTEKQISDTDASKIKAILTSTEKKPFITEFKATSTTASPLKTIEKNSLIAEVKTTTPLISQSISKTPLASQAKTSFEKKPFITEAKITPTKQVSSTTQPTKEPPKPLVTEIKPNTVPLTEIKVAPKKSFITEERVAPTKPVSSTMQPTKEIQKPLVAETKPNTVPLTEIKAAPKRSFITEEKVVPLKSTPTIPTVEKKELIKEVKMTTPIKQTTNTTPLPKTTLPEKKPLITETKPNVLVTPTTKPLITEEKINQVPKTTAPTLPPIEKKPLVPKIKNKEEEIEVKKDNSSINITDNKNKVNTASTTPIETKTPAVQVPKQQENKIAIKKEPTIMKKAEKSNSDTDSDLPILGED